MRKRGLPPDCHPERKHASMGMCGLCYSRYRNYNKLRRDKFFEMYGTKCALCPETDVVVLSMDHPKGDGTLRRGKHKHNQPEYTRAIKTYMPESYRVLCLNCQHREKIRLGLLRKPNSYEGFGAKGFRKKTFAIR